MFKVKQNMRFRSVPERTSRDSARVEVVAPRHLAEHCRLRNDLQMLLVEEKGTGFAALNAVADARTDLTAGLAAVKLTVLLARQVDDAIVPSSTLSNNREPNTKGSTLAIHLRKVRFATLLATTLHVYAYGCAQAKCLRGDRC